MLGWEQFSLFYFLLFCIYQHFYVSIYIFIKENFDLFLGRDFRSWLLGRDPHKLACSSYG